MERTRLHEDGRDRTAALVETRFDDETAGGTFDRGLQFKHFGLQKDVFQEFVHALAGLGGDRAEGNVAAPFFRHHVVGDQFLLDAFGIGFGLVDLVDRHDQGNAGRTGVRNGFLRLRHHAVVGRDHENDDVGRLRAAGAHGRKGFVTRGVEEGDDAARGLDVIGADVLRNAARFTRGDLGAADVVKERGLAVVDVTHDRDDRRTRQGFVVLLFGEFPEDRFGIVRLGGDRLVAHFLDDDHRGVLVEHLVDRHHLAHLHEGLDDFGRLDAHLVGEVRNRNGFGDLHFTHHGFHGLRRRFGTAVAVLAAAAARGAPAALFRRLVFAARLHAAAAVLFFAPAVVAGVAALLALLLFGSVGGLGGTGFLLGLLDVLALLLLRGLLFLFGLGVGGGLRSVLGLFFLRSLLRRHDARLAVHHFADAAGLFLGLLARFFAAAGVGLHALGGGGGDFGFELSLFGFAAGGLQTCFVVGAGGLFLGALLGGFGFQAGRFGALFGGAAFGFETLTFGLFGGLPAGLFLGLAAFGFAGFLFGAARGFGAGFGLKAGLLFGEDLGVLHEDALSADFDLNRVRAARSVVLLDHARFLARHADLALLLGALRAQALEEPRLVGFAQFVRHVALGDARGAELLEKELRSELEFAGEIIHRFTCHKCSSP